MAWKAKVIRPSGPACIEARNLSAMIDATLRQRPPEAVASPPFVLRQAQHEAPFFVASPNKMNLILSSAKDEAAAPAAGTRFPARSARWIGIAVALVLLL